VSNVSGRLGSIPHFVMTGTTSKFGSLKKAAMRRQFRKLDIDDDTISKFFEDLGRGVPRHPLLGPAFFETAPENIRAVMGDLERLGITCVTCDCAWESDVENVGGQGEDLLDRWLRIGSPELKPTLALVRENLPANDVCIWVGPATVVDMGVRSLGCIVLTDSHIAVGYSNKELDQVYSQIASRGDGSEIRKLRGSSTGETFRIEGVLLQSIEMESGAYFAFETALNNSRAISLAMIEEPETPVALQPLDAMKQLQEMLDQGFISESDFEEKKQDILKRL